MLGSILNTVKSVTVKAVDFLNTPVTPTVPVPNVVVTNTNEKPKTKVWYSQLDPKWKNKWMPNTSNPNITIGRYGCLLTCVANLYNTTPDVMGYAHKDCFLADGNMAMDMLVGQNGGKLTRKTLVEGKPIPKFDKPVIARTSYYLHTPLKAPTHFYIILPDGKIVDPASTYPVPTSKNIYAMTTNEVRIIDNVKV